MGGWAPVRGGRPHDPDVTGGCRGGGPRGPPRHPTLTTPWGPGSWGGGGGGLWSTPLRLAGREPPPQGGRRVTGGDATAHVEGAM